VILPPINEEIEKNNRARRRIINPLQSLWYLRNLTICANYVNGCLRIWQPGRVNAEGGLNMLQLDFLASQISYIICWLERDIPVAF
jgi:hypothetical protein